MTNTKNTIKNGLILLGSAGVIVLFIFMTRGIATVDAGEITGDPCAERMTRDNTVKQVEQWIGNCEIAIEQTGLDYDVKAKAHEIEMQEMKTTNEARREKIDQVREEILGGFHDPSPSEDLGKE